MSKRSLAAVAGATLLVAVAAGLAWRAAGRVDTVAARLRSDLRRTPFAQHQQVYARYLPLIGAGAVLDEVERENTFCHTQGHPVGMAIFAMTRDLHASIEACGYRCTGGCFHGVLTAALKEASTHTASADSPATLEQMVAHGKEICSRSDTAEHLGSCAHGVGHAFTFLAGYEVDRAVHACHTFDDVHLQYYCASGAYMERDMAYGTADAAGASPLRPCDAESEFPAACYRYKIGRLTSHQSWDRIGQLCETLAGHQRLGCFHGLGYAARDAVSRTPGALRTLCGAGDRNDQLMCIEGVIYTLADFKSASVDPACTSLEPTLALACRQAAKDGLYSLDKPIGLYVALAAETRN